MESHANIESNRVTEKPNGPVAAVMLASGIGAFVLGLLTVLAEASTSVHDFLPFNEGVGPLSGKTTLTVAAFVISWLIIGNSLSKKDVDIKKVLTVTIVLLVIAVIMTFPTFFLAFKAD